MADHDLRSVVRDVAAEPESVRATSPLLPRLEVALQRAGLLGDPARLPELGMVLREAGLTRGQPYGDSRRDFLSFCPTPEEFAAWQKADAAAFEESYANDDNLSDDERDFKLHWHGWQVPPVGTVVSRHQPYAAPYNYFVIEGAVTEPLLVREKHGGCRTCECWNLNQSLGWWVGHSLRRGPDGAWGRGPDLEVYRRVEPPWCLRATDVVLA